VIDAIGVMDWVDVGKGIGVPVGVDVRVGEIVGDDKLAVCVCFKFGVEVHPRKMIRKVTNVNSLNFIFHLSVVNVWLQIFSYFTSNLHRRVPKKNSAG
jgi:hypothetical protein